MSIEDDLVKLKSIIASKSGNQTGKLATQAISSMRDSVNNNQAVMAEVIRQISVRPKEFLIVRDNKGDMTKIIPVYPDER